MEKEILLHIAYGGLVLSQEAADLLGRGRVFDHGGGLFSLRDSVPRDDPALLSAAKKLGSKFVHHTSKNSTSWRYGRGNVAIVTVNVDFGISDHDGIESLHPIVTETRRAYLQDFDEVKDKSVA